MGKFSKTVKKSLFQKGGSVNFNIGNQRWENTAHGAVSRRYSEQEVHALNTLGVGTLDNDGSTQSYNPNSNNWYLIKNGQPPPRYGTTLSKVINEIYVNDPPGAIETFTMVQRDIASATNGREKAASRYPDSGPQADSHRAYLNALQDLVRILRSYTNPGFFTGATGIIKSLFKTLRGDTAESSSNSDDESSSPKRLGKFERMSSERNGGKRKSRKSRKSRKIKFRKSKNKRQ
jgi:hypothetical protein